MYGCTTITHICCSFTALSACTPSPTAHRLTLLLLLCLAAQPVPVWRGAEDRAHGQPAMVRVYRHCLL